MTLSLCLVIWLLGAQLWSISCFLRVRSSKFYSPKQAKTCGSGLGRSWCRGRGPGWYHLTLFVRADNQFGNSPFSIQWGCLGVVVFGLPTFTFVFFFHILYEGKLELGFCRYQWVDFRWRGLRKQIHCCRIFITDIICIAEGKGCVNGETLEIAFSPFPRSYCCIPVWNAWQSTFSVTAGACSFFFTVDNLQMSKPGFIWSGLRSNSCPKKFMIIIFFSSNMLWFVA